MKLKHRLSLYAIAIFSIIILVVSFIIYISFYTHTAKIEQQSLESKTLLAGIYYLEKDELSALEHENIKSRLIKNISRKDIAIYDEQDKRFDGEMVSDTDVAKQFINQVRRDNSTFFETSAFFYHGLFYKDNQGDFVVITRQSKTGFQTQMNSLLRILFFTSIVGIVFIYLFSQFLGYIAYAPIIRIVRQIKERDAQNFNEPIQLGKSYAEVEDLVQTYNHFVARLSQTFHVQKNFIDYVSHELRTPITALLGTLEVTNNRKRTIEEYEITISKLKQYTADLQAALDDMMLLSGAKTSFEFVAIRIDEIIWKIIENAILYHKAQIEVDIKVKDTSLMTMQANDRLLELAIGNIIENAIKYSNNKPVLIRFEEINNRLNIVILDQGIGIPAQDLPKIKENFFRGQNTTTYQGKGIGLSMASIIFTLHQIDMTVVSEGEGTSVILTI